MIISKHINPERDLYYLGAKTIGIIDSLDESEIDFFTVFSEFNKNEKVSINLFILTLDWLYMIGAINMTEENLIKKCF